MQNILKIVHNSVWHCNKQKMCHIWACIVAHNSSNKIIEAQSQVWSWEILQVGCWAKNQHNTCLSAWTQFYDYRSLSKTFLWLLFSNKNKHYFAQEWPSNYLSDIFLLETCARCCVHIGLTNLHKESVFRSKKNVWFLFS